MGEEWAQSRDIPVLRMPANWKSYGKRAGYIRNQEMADIADHVLVFWDGHSRGSRHMIDISHQMEIPVTIVKGG
jgi:hypothetical protein